MEVYEARGETNLIPVEVDYLAKILLPRTAGQFTRNGLIVKGLRYHLDGCDERYLAGGTVVVAYDPDCVDEVWLLESGYYKVFRLIERCYSGLSMDDALSQKERKNTIIRVAKENGVQGRIDMISHIETVSQASIQQPLAEKNRMQRNRNAEKQRTAKR